MSKKGEPNSSNPNEPIPLPEGSLEPPPEGETDRTTFIRALMAGNAATAANALRALDALTHTELDILADLFDGEPALADIYPYRLKLVPRKPGKPPTDYLTKQAREQALARAMILAIAKFGKVEAAVSHVQHQHKLLTNAKLSRSTIIKCYSAHKDKFHKESH